MCNLTGVSTNRKYIDCNDSTHSYKYPQMMLIKGGRKARDSIFLNIFLKLLLIYQLMRSVFKIKTLFSSKKLGIADTAKVIQDKIMNITQVVLNIIMFRMMLKNLELSLVLVMVLPELLDLIKFKQVKWWSLDQVLEVWL